MNGVAFQANWRGASPVKSEACHAPSLLPGAEISQYLMLSDCRRRKCAVAREALRVLHDEKLCERSRELGAWFLGELRTIRHEAIREVRGVGLLTGIELHGAARPYCERLMELGLLCKETHDHVIRIAPPLVISREDLAWAVARVKETFAA